MIRIMMCSTTPIQRDGITGVMINLYNNIDRTKYQIDFIAINPPVTELRSQIENNGGKITVIPRTMKHPLNYILQFASVCRGYDIVHVHGNSSTMVLEMIGASIAGVKVKIAHSHNTYCTSKIIDMFSRPLFNYLCDVRIACGEEAGRWLFRNKNFSIINNGIETYKYQFSMQKRQEVRKKLNLEDCVILGQVGNFLKAKNHFFTIDMFHVLARESDSYKLLLLGDGPLKEELIQYAKKVDVFNRIVFVGSVDNVVDYLSAMDFFVMPSKNEGLPLTAIEAQANGLSCILSDQIENTVDLTGNVTFMSIDKCEEWGEKIKNSIKEEDRLKKSQISISNIIKNGYDIKKSVSTLERIYDNAVKQFR